VADGPNTNGLLYGIIGALGVAVVGGGLYLYQTSRTADAPPVAAATQTPTPAPPPAATPRPTPPPAPPAGPSAAQVSQVRGYIADARRWASQGSFPEAEASLQAADRILPGFAETATARRDIAEMRTARGQVGPLVADARRAIQRRDFAAADRALDQAERLDPRSPEVIDARRDLRDAQRRAAQRDIRIDALVATARAAIARHDYVAADRALDEAERIDGRDREVQEARAELSAAQRPGRPPRN
jgi:tetratricopeptide (TPR) repeat protein